MQTTPTTQTATDYAELGFDTQPSPEPVVDPLDAFLALDCFWSNDPELAHIS